MEYRCREPRVYVRDPAEQLYEVVDASGAACTALLGIMPEKTVSFEAADFAKDGILDVSVLGGAIKKILDLGYRKIILPISGISLAGTADSFRASVAETNDAEQPDHRLKECEFVLLSENRCILAFRLGNAPMPILI